MATPVAAPQPSLVTTPLLVVAIVFPVLGTFAVGLRFYTKIMTKKRPSADDWVCALAQLAAWGISIDVFVAAGLAGVDYTYPDLDPISAAAVFLRALWIEGFPLILSLTFVKIAILLFYARIFTTRKFRLAIHIYNGILIAWCIAMTVCQLLAADPIESAWNPLATTSLRYNYNDFSLAFAGMSMVFDVIVLFFPIPVIHKLQMSWARKLQALAIFWLGIFCCISSAVRFYYLFAEIRRTTADMGPNRYLRISTAFIWGTIEPNASIIAACLPCYAPLFAKFHGIPTLLANFGSLLSSSRGRRGSRAKEQRGRELLDSNDSYQLQKPYDGPGSWDSYDGARPTYAVDVERANSSQGYQESFKDASQIKVTRDFTTTESRGPGH